MLKYNCNDFFHFKEIFSWYSKNAFLLKKFLAKIFFERKKSVPFLVEEILNSNEFFSFGQKFLLDNEVSFLNLLRYIFIKILMSFFAVKKNFFTPRLESKYQGQRL